MASSSGGPAGFVRSHGVPAAALLALLSLVLLAAVGPPSDLDQPVLLAALGAIAAVAYSLKIWLESDDADDVGGTTFDATVAIVLVALYVGGPLPALAVWLVPDLLHRCVFRRTQILTPGLAVNVASFASATLAGGALLSVVGGAPGLLVAGAVMVQLNFALSPLLYAALFEGPEDRRLLLAEHLALTPITVVMLTIAVATALLSDAAGYWALLPLSVALVLPEVRWRSVAARLRPEAPAAVSGLGRQIEATEELLDVVLEQLDAVLATRAHSEGATDARRGGIRSPARAPRGRGHGT